MIREEEFTSPIYSDIGTITLYSKATFYQEFSKMDDASVEVKKVQA